MVSRDTRPEAIADLLGIVRAMHLAKRRASIEPGSFTLMTSMPRR